MVGLEPSMALSPRPFNAGGPGSQTQAQSPSESVRTARATEGGVEALTRQTGVRDSVVLSKTAQNFAKILSAQSQTSEKGGTSGPGQELTEEEQKQVATLKKRDQEVRAHEMAHQRVGGPYASAPSYEYQKGPDGKRYAVGGEVQIDASPIPGDPDATIEKMRVVKAAALAPAEPSGQDRKVAAQADATAQQARAEKSQMEREEREAAAKGEASPNSSPGPQSVSSEDESARSSQNDSANSDAIRASTAYQNSAGSQAVQAIIAIIA